MSITYKELKGPKGFPVIGNLHKIEINNMHNQIEGWAKEYGGVYKLDLGPSKLTVITAPKMIQEVLSNRPNKFRRMSKMDGILAEAGVNGVFNAEGEKWKSHRALVNKGLDVKHQQQFYPEIMVSLGRLFNKWNSAAAEASGIDIQQDLLRFTVDVTTSLAFGYKMNTLEKGDGDVIQNHLEKIFPTIFKRINSPIPTWRYIKSKKDKVFDGAVAEINRFIDELIKDGKQRLSDQPELRTKPTNLLESLLVAAEEDQNITDEDVRGNLITILMAGEDTTAHTLAWAIYMLAQHPEIQEKLHSEAKDLLEGEWLTQYNQHSKLLYTEAVALETMRIKPVAPIMLFEPLEDIEMDGYLFKKGAKIMIQSRYGSMHEDHFEKGEEFLPERWIKEEQGKCPMGHDTKAYIPFGSGARFCPGKNLAMLEMKLVLSMLMKNFKVELVTPQEEVKEVMAFTMMPSAYQVKLIKR